MTTLYFNASYVLVEPVVTPDLLDEFYMALASSYHFDSVDMRMDSPSDFSVLIGFTVPSGYDENYAYDIVTKALKEAESIPVLQRKLQQRPSIPTPKYITE